MQGPSASEEEDSHIAAINIIPLVDVVLVLLIIFMITAVFTHESAMKLDLPTASSQHPAQPPTEVTVNVDSGANITVNGRPTELSHLKDTIEMYKSNDPNRKTLLVLRGDKGVLYGKIIPVLDEIGQTGLEMTLAVKNGLDQQ
jgi:biopolymer transport protein ExbD